MRAAGAAAVTGSMPKAKPIPDSSARIVLPACLRPGRSLRVLPGEPLVKLDAKAGPVRDADLSVRKLFRRNDQILAPRRLTPSVLEGQKIGQSGTELYAGSGRNRPTGIMRRHQDAIGFRQRGNLERLEDPAAMLYIGHNDVHRSPPAHGRKTFQPEKKFPARHALRDFRTNGRALFHPFGRNRFLIPVEILRLQAPGYLDTERGIKMAVAIDQQIGVRADGAPYGFHARDAQLGELLPLADWSIQFWEIVERGGLDRPKTFFYRFARVGGEASRRAVLIGRPVDVRVNVQFVS